MRPTADPLPSQPYGRPYEPPCTTLDLVALAALAAAEMAAASLGSAARHARTAPGLALASAALLAAGALGSLAVVAGWL